MMKHIFIAACFVCMLAFKADAQTANADIAYAGENAVFVYHAFPPVSPLYPNNGFTGYKLEREDTAAPGSWVLIKEFHTPQNPGELLENFLFSMRFFPDAKQIKFDAEKSWNTYLKYKTLDSLSFELAYTPTQMAFNILVADTTVKAGKTYKYRVSQTGVAATAGVIITNPVAFPAIIKAIKPTVLRRIAEPNAIRIEWFAKGKITSYGMKVFRRSDDEKAYTQIKPYTFVEVKHDSLVYSIRDEGVGFSTMYHYYITPVNSFGGGGNIQSDTVHATCMDPQKLLTPQYFIATGDEVNKAIKLKYTLPDPAYIGGIDVMRSDFYDKGYKKIGVATVRDSVYMDYRITAGQKYYYYLVMIDKMGRPAIRGNKTFGLYQSKKNNYPARFLTAVKQGKSVLVGWTNPPGEKLSGYYVYRCEGVGMPLKRLSLLIPQRDSTGSYLDNYNFKPGITYGYSVRSENLSNIESQDSKIIYIVPADRDTMLSSPKNLQASRQNNVIRLTWLDMRRFNKSQMGYRITRREGNSKDGTILEDNYPVFFSTYVDSTAKTGITYIYDVESITKNTSAKSTSNGVALPIQRYPSPLGLVAYNTPSGISLTWQKVIDTRIKQFAIYRYTRGTKPQLIATVPAAKAAYVDKQAVKGKTYYFYVRCTGDEKAAASANSNEAFLDY